MSQKVLHEAVVMLILIAHLYTASITNFNFKDNFYLLTHKRQILAMLHWAPGNSLHLCTKETAKLVCVCFCLFVFFVMFSVLQLKVGYSKLQSPLKSLALSHPNECTLLCLWP